MLRRFIVAIFLFSLFSCAVSITQIRTSGKYHFDVVKVKGKGVKYPSAGVIIIGEPGLRADIYIEKRGGLARYLAERGMEVWVYDIDNDDTFESLRDGVIPALVDMMNAESGIEEVSILCHGFSCLPVMDAILRGYKRYFVKNVLMLSPPLFSWGFTKAFEYILTKNVNGDEMKVVPEFSKSGESLLELLYCDENMIEEDKKFVLNSLKEIPPFWISFMRRFTSERVNLLSSYCALPIPSIAIAGQADAFIPYWSSLPPEINENECKSKFRFFGRANFDRKEYSHLGLIVGKDAHKEIFPFIYNWLKFGWKESNWMREYSNFPGE